MRRTPGRVPVRWSVWFGQIPGEPHHSRRKEAPSADPEGQGENSPGQRRAATVALGLPNHQPQPLPSWSAVPTCRVGTADHEENESSAKQDGSGTTPNLSESLTTQEPEYSTRLIGTVELQPNHSSVPLEFGAEYTTLSLPMSVPRES